MNLAVLNSFLFPLWEHWSGWELLALAITCAVLCTARIRDL